MPLHDAIGQEIKVRSRVLWSRNGAYAGFQDGILTVEKLNPKTVRMAQRAYNGRPLVAMASALIVVDPNLEVLEKKSAGVAERQT